MPVAGAEGFYVGLAYPFITPALGLSILSAGLMAGGFETDRIREFLAAFLVSLIAGTIALGGVLTSHAPLLATVVASSCLAALAPGRLRTVALVLAAGVGLFVGAATRDPGPVLEQATVIAGTFVGANLGVLFVSVGSDLIREKARFDWVAIAFRVAAAWVGAVAVLALALEFAPPH